MRKQQTPPKKQNKVLQSLRSKVGIQAMIAIQTVIITVAIIFGMSAAWYTNVVQTGGLQFEAAAWGFTGEVIIEEQPVEAGPGDSGLIGLNVHNAGDEIVDVAVQVSKELMDKNMSQRLFFYVDTPLTRNEEPMDRVYINSRESYTYTLLGQKDLVLTESRSNDVLLKWQWVYDVQGYYFLGTVKAQAGIDNAKIAVADVEDYLRPVEYDLDRALFVDGELSMVGEQTLQQFLESLSQTDGYTEPITQTDMPGYYQLGVDENGYGIWLYLCNWAEIQQATTYDSQLGQDALQAITNQTTPARFVARLMVVGQPNQETPAEITNGTQLQTQLSSGGVLQLQNDLKLTQPLTVTGGEKTVLDLNGHTITGPDKKPVLTLTEAANLIVMNGAIVAQNEDEDAINVENSTLTLSGMKLSGTYDDMIYVTDEKAEGDSLIRIFDCEADAKGCAVYVRGNGEASPGRTQVIVEDSTLTSDFMTIMGNGTNTYWGTDIQVYNSTLEGYYTAIYQPQNDSLTRLISSTATGGTGVVVKGGRMEIVDSAVKGTFPKKEPKLEKSGFTDTGDAVFVDCSYGVLIEVTISGLSTMESANSDAVQVFVPDGEINRASVTITGGTFSSDVSTYVPSGYIYDPIGGTVTKDAAPEEAQDE